MRHEDHFSIFANQAIRDGRLSGLARSVLFELLSRPPGWQSNADRMWRQARKDRGDRAEGRRAFRAAFAELEEFGYLVRDLDRSGNRVETVMHLYHIPQEGSGKGSRNPSGNGSRNGVTGEADGQQAGEGDGTAWGTGSGTPQSGTSESGTSESGTSETGTSLRSTDHGSTDVGSTEDEESFRARSARSGSIASDQASDDEQARQAELERRWNLVRALSPDEIHEAMHALEKRRPQIYRDCRQRAIAQYEREKPGAPAILVDQLSYMYALMHYFNGVTPMCLAKPIGIAS
ncbi:hypothetical protein [Streptomonospora wellingtoniae]|uniref:Helix-turn-helix domain-containing protein n=1 Tax=Streptomonospora wellingtoniae TaxID=3075544 RepID=A0ABU2KUS6_9ACTN|nr:hypothetical protein [Streptomonospora sp. DSM 45055]MDT0302878.1 hypothetical protein [Streptomonospora sp. DSM 45055]